jgi:hypothetical protein
LVISYDETVNIDLRLKNYNSATATESFFQPGGLYEARETDGVKRLVPRFQSAIDYTPSDPSLNWSTAAEFLPSDATDPNQAIIYVGHERIENKSFSDGNLSALNRYFCVFDETPGGQPQIEVKIGALTGASAQYSMVANTATLIDVRDSTGKRMCRLPSSASAGVQIPRMVKSGVGIGFSLDSTVLDTATTPLSCLPVEVTDAAQIFDLAVIDKVGNIKDGYNIDSGTGLTLTSPPSDDVDKTFTGTRLTLKTKDEAEYRTTQTIAANLTATGPATINQKILFEALAKRPERFSVVVSNNEIVTADESHLHGEGQIWQFY